MLAQPDLTQIVNGSIEKLGSSDRNCSICGKFLEAKAITLLGIGTKMVAVACSCETNRLKQEERFASLRETNGHLHNFSDDDQMVANATFGSFDKEPGTSAGFNVATDFAMNIADWGPRGFYLHGKNGVGKSFLLTAVTDWLRKRGHSVIFTTGKTLIQRAKPAMQKLEVLEAYRTCDVLIIDEIGADVPADWEIGDLFTVMNARQGRKPILYGSNFSIKELEQKMNAKQAGWGTRLMERIIKDTADQILMQADSKRFEKHAENKAWLKGRLKKNV
ncbi:ATP-binding protein [Paenibacillus chitinolyticus]